MGAKYPRISVIRFAQSILPQYEGVLREEGMPTLLVAVLYETGRLQTLKSSPVELEELKVAMGMDASTLSRQITALVSRKAVRRAFGTEDARRRRVELTPEGERILKRIETRLCHLRQGAWEKVSDVHIVLAPDARITRGATRRTTQKESTTGWLF
jgi:DNA-binding MarR family transcriptional regulator